MKYTIAMIAVSLTLIGCDGSSGPDFASAFPDLEKDHLEIRLGNMPELDAGQCNRNMYAGLRTNKSELLKLTIDLVATPTGSSSQRYERELLLEETSEGDLVAGQVSLFPDNLNHACRDVDVDMLTIRCSFGSEERSEACPGKIRWQWLQGFKMIKPPKSVR